MENTFTTDYVSLTIYLLSNFQLLIISGITSKVPTIIFKREQTLIEQLQCQENVSPEFIIKGKMVQNNILVQRLKS